MTPQEFCAHTSGLGEPLLLRSIGGGYYAEFAGEYAVEFLEDRGWRYQKGEAKGRFSPSPREAAMELSYSLGAAQIAQAVDDAILERLQREIAQEQGGEGDLAWYPFKRV